MAWISPPPADTEPYQRFSGSLPKQRRNLVRNNPRNDVFLGATMGATIDNILQIFFYYQQFEDTIR
jgi:hypothetical protein